MHFAKSILLPTLLAALLVLGTHFAGKYSSNSSKDVLAAFTGGTLTFPPDQSLCQFNPSTITAYISYSSVPAGSTATLQTSWRIINPPSKATGTVYTTKQVTGSGQEPIVAQWPGISPGDSVVEIHYGAALLNATTGQPVVTEGLDYYWYPWVCSQSTPDAPTPSPTPTPTPVPSVSVSPSVSGTPTPTPSPTPTATPNITPTPGGGTPSATPTPSQEVTTYVTPTPYTTADSTNQSYVGGTVAATGSQVPETGFTNITYAIVSGSVLLFLGILALLTKKTHGEFLSKIKDIDQD